MTVNAAIFAPLPSASVRIATSVSLDCAAASGRVPDVFSKCIDPTGVAHSDLPPNFLRRCYVGIACQYRCRSATKRPVQIDSELELPLAKASQRQQSPVVRLSPDVAAIDSNAVLVPACRREEHSRPNADAFEQCGSMQL